MRRVLLALGWFFLISKIVGFGVAIPHSAVMAHSKQDCEAIRQTVEYFIEVNERASDCRDETKNYIGVPIYWGS